MRTDLLLPLLGSLLIPIHAASQCTVDAGGDVTLYLGYPPMECATLTASATGQGSLSYLWSNGETTQSITVCDQSSTTYTVTITDTAGCTATDSVMVTVIDVSCEPNGKVLVCHIPPGNPANAHTICIGAPAVAAHLAHGCTLGPCTSSPPPPDCEVDLGPDFTLCPGDTATLDAGAGFVSYEWSDGSTEQTLVVTAAGTYSVTATDSAGCEADDEVEVNDDTDPPLDLGPDTTLCSGDTLLLDAGAGFADYLWSDSSIGQTLLIDTIGVYWVTVIDSFGCIASDTIVVDDCDSFMFGGPRFGVNVYPNPTSQTLSVEYLMATPSYVTVEVMSVTGSRAVVLYEGYSDIRGAIVNANIGHLPPGVYVARLKAATGYEYHEKFLLMRE